MKYTECKIRIKNKQHGISIQKALFAHDITWRDQGKNIAHHKMAYLITSSDGHIN